MSRSTQLNHKITQVVVLVLENNQGDVLLTKRKADTHLPLYWEFPGGKVEHNESIIQALSRECIEEIDYTPINPNHILSINHNYPSKLVLLEFFHEINEFPQVSAAEGQQMQWVKKEHLYRFKLPEANKSIIRYLLNE